MTQKTYKYSLNVELPDPELNSLIWNLVEAMQKEAVRVGSRPCHDKANAVYLKWVSLSFLKAEIDTLDISYASHGMLRTLDYSLIISKIEAFLTQARAILDILAYGLSLSLSSGPGRESVNDFRKRKDLPNEFAEFFEESLNFDPEYGLSENGWLTLLVTDHPRYSLRDFVTHKGTLKLVTIPQAGGGSRFGFFPLKAHTAHSHVSEVLENIHDGMNEFFGLVIRHLSKSSKG